MQIGVQSDQISNRRKRIVINIDKHSRKSRQSNDESDSMFNPQKQLPKLIDISERCFQYYDKFKEDRLEEEQYMEIMFSQLLKFLEDSFKDLIHKLTTKQTELKNAVLQKKREFSNFHPNHFLSLTEKVEHIRQQKIYLQKLTPQQVSIFTINFNSEGEAKQNQYSQFAKLLNSFYNEIQTIEKNTFKDHVQQSTTFLRNLIKDQFDLFNKKIGEEVESTPGGNISFNNEQLFSIKEFKEQNSEQSWEEFRAQTQRTQRQLESKIDGYSFRMKVF